MLLALYGETPPQSIVVFWYQRKTCMQYKRLVYFLLINVFVSALTTLTVLLIWDRTHRPAQIELEQQLTAVVFPTATTVAEKSQAPVQAYQIGPNESLGEIAFAFDVTVEEIQILNGIDNPDSVGAGQIIFVPASPTGDVQIGIVAVTASGDLGSERVQIRNFGEAGVALAGWTLEDEDGNQYQFPQITLYTGAIDIYSRAGVDQAYELFWGAATSIWEVGETVTLRDYAGNIQAQETVK